MKSKTTKIKKEGKGFTTKESLETSKQTQATDASYSADRLLKCNVIVRYLCCPRMSLSENSRLSSDRALLENKLRSTERIIFLVVCNSYNCIFPLTSFLLFTVVEKYSLLYAYITVLKTNTAILLTLTLRRLMSYIYIYIYIWSTHS